MEHAVDPEPDPHVALPGLDVHVRRALGDGLGHDRVDELDDGRVLERGFEVVLLTFAPLGCLGRQLFDVGIQAGELRDRGFDVCRGGDHRLHVAAGDRPDVVERVDVRGIGHRDQQLPVAIADGQRPVPPREGFGEQRGGGRIDLRVGQVDELEADLFGERADEVGLPDHAEVDQHPAESFGCLLMLLEGSVELLRRDEAEFDQDLPELLRLPLDGGHRRSIRSRSAAHRYAKGSYLLASSSSLGT